MLYREVFHETFRVLDSDESDEDDDVALDVLRERALKSAREKLTPKKTTMKRKGKRGKGAYEQMYRKGSWKQLNNSREVIVKTGRRKASIGIQVNEFDFDNKQPAEMDLSSDEHSLVIITKLHLKLKFI